MKALIRRTASLLLVLALVLSAGIAFPAMAADGQEGQPAEIKQSGQTEESSEKPLTDAEKQALAIKKYGKYKGTNASRIPVLTYHNVVTDKVKRNRYSGDTTVISKSNFEKQMRWLKRNGYRTINCEEFYLWYKGKIKLPKKSVLITMDDAREGVAENALPILKKYKLKATSFVIGAWTLKGKDGYMEYDVMREIQKDYPDLEFQSHTYNLHTPKASLSGYAKALKDAKKQKARYGFEFLAYPYGRNNDQMVKAYKKAGIRMAFTYGRYGSGYATRKQDQYRIKRIKVEGNFSMAQFRSIFS